MELSHAGLLQFQHIHKCRPMLVLLKLLKEGFLCFGHRTRDAMTLTFVFANIDTWAWVLGHN
ncbi:hypothetical protein SAMN05444003_3069 [Cognatiyoonia sediminum]|uniref:Uncharacterized protein n=1 Tax=Cognatiyoonia sediminum TaxID=1508389 RepID=A0A1M5SRY3_9RHOB|nr:hypothetical protein SAMN05444003_3069 [Cognatiyoonia sediminum]